MPNATLDPRQEHVNLLVERGTLSCVVCTADIPAERIMRKAVTCCEDHAQALKNIRRTRRDMKRCRLCNRPCTPEERADYARWRKERDGDGRGRPKGSKNKPRVEVEQDSTPPVQDGDLE